MAIYNLALILENLSSDFEFIIAKQNPPLKFDDREFDSFVDFDFYDLPSRRLDLSDGEFESNSRAIEGMKNINLRKFDILSTMNKEQQVGFKVTDGGEWRFLQLGEEADFGNKGTNTFFSSKDDLFANQISKIGRCIC